MQFLCSFQACHDFFVLGFVSDLWNENVWIHVALRLREMQIAKYRCQKKNCEIFLLKRWHNLVPNHIKLGTTVLWWRLNIFERGILFCLGNAGVALNILHIHFNPLLGCHFLLPFCWWFLQVILSEYWKPYSQGTWRVLLILWSIKACFELDLLYLVLKAQEMHIPRWLLFLVSVNFGNISSSPICLFALSKSNLIYLPS